MSTGETTHYGKISISPEAIATIASRAASESYGIVGMAPKNLVDGLANAIAKDPRHGVEVRSIGGSILIDLYVVVEYGTRIASVASSVANTVQYQVERMIGMQVAAVNVHVQDLRVSHRD